MQLSLALARRPANEGIPPTTRFNKDFEKCVERKLKKNSFAMRATALDFRRSPSRPSQVDGSILRRAGDVAARVV